MSFAIRQAISGAAAVFTPGNAQDQMGYYYEYWAYPGTFYYSADHYLFNVGATLAEQNIQSNFVNGALLGFGVTPGTAGLTNAASNDYLRYFLKGGVQVTAYPRGAGDLPTAGLGITIPIGIYFNHARGSEQSCAPGIGQLCSPGAPGAEVNTGPAMVKLDGHEINYTVTDSGGSYALVTFPCPGDYTLEATLPGTSAGWKTVAHVYSADTVTDSVYYETDPATGQQTNTGPHPWPCRTSGTCRQAGVRGCGGYRPPVSASGGPGTSTARIGLDRLGWLTGATALVLLGLAGLLVGRLSRNHAPR